MRTWGKHYGDIGEILWGHGGNIFSPKQKLTLTTQKFNP